MDPIDAVAGALASAHQCGACSQEFQDAYLRDFHGVPVCVDCYRDLGLLTIGALEAAADEALMGRLLSAAQGEVAAGPARRFGIAERLASRVAPGGAEVLLVSAARGGAGTGMQEVLWVLLAAAALMRSGGRNGTLPLADKELSLLLNVCARVGMDVAWAAMVDCAVARRTLDPLGEEWVYEDLVGGAGMNPGGLAAEREAFARFIRALKGKVDLLVEDIKGRRDEVDIPLGILARTAQDILAAFGMMEKGPPRRGSAAGDLGP